MTAFITVCDEFGNDHLVNTAHIVRLTQGTGRPMLYLTQGLIAVAATPNCPHPSPADEVHQDIIDQLAGKA